MPQLPDGTYLATALEATLGAADTGTPYIGVLFHLKEAGTKLTWRGFFTEKTQERTIDALRACGWKGDDLSEVGFPTGNEVEVVVKNEEWEGKVYPRILWVNAIRGPMVKNAMPAGERKAFAEKMRGVILAYDQANAPTDVPF